MDRDWWGEIYDTMTPKEKPAMTEFSMDTAASWRVPTWPAKVWVMAPSEYWQMEVKMAGPARYHSFLDSTQNSFVKPPNPLMGSMSPSATKEEAVDGSCFTSSPSSSSLFRRRGSLLLVVFSIDSLLFVSPHTRLQGQLPWYCWHVCLLRSGKMLFYNSLFSIWRSDTCCLRSVCLLFIHFVCIFSITRGSNICFRRKTVGLTI